MVSSVRPLHTCVDTNSSIPPSNTIALINYFIKIISHIVEFDCKANSLFLLTEFIPFATPVEQKITNWLTFCFIIKLVNYDVDKNWVCCDSSDWWSIRSTMKFLTGAQEFKKCTKARQLLEESQNVHYYHVIVHMMFATCPRWPPWKVWTWVPWGCSFLGMCFAFIPHRPLKNFSGQSKLVRQPLWRLLANCLQQSVGVGCCVSHVCKTAWLCIFSQCM